MSAARRDVLTAISAAALMLMPDTSSARPNFVVLLVDDAGFMDFGGYGGEASTPNIDRLPDDFYSSRFLLDKTLEYLEARDPDRPFFAYVAFQAVHIPVQAPREFTDRYTGVYLDGWEATLERRFERARALGLVRRRMQRTMPDPSPRQT